MRVRERAFTRGTNLLNLLQAMKTYEDPSLSNRYSVRFDESRRVVEFLEADIIGPGFQSVGSVQLQPGQVVFVTHNQREMQARVIRHDYETQDVLLRINEVILLVTTAVLYSLVLKALLHSH